MAKHELELKIDKESFDTLDEIKIRIDKYNKLQELTNLLFCMLIILSIVSVSLNMSNADKLHQIEKDKTTWYKKLHKELVRLDLIEINEDK